MGVDGDGEGVHSPKSASVHRMAKQRSFHFDEDLSVEGTAADRSGDSASTSAGSKPSANLHRRSNHAQPERREQDWLQSDNQRVPKLEAESVSEGRS